MHPLDYLHKADPAKVAALVERMASAPEQHATTQASAPLAGQPVIHPLGSSSAAQAPTKPFNTSSGSPANPQADPHSKPADIKSGEDIIRGSTNIPLSQEGLDQVRQLGERLAVKGGFDRIICSDLTRTVQTAQAISEATGTPITRETGELHPWHLGEIEGQPTKQVLDQMNRYVLKKPDVAVPGRGVHSSHDGEAFNTFKRRLLGFMKGELADLKKDPEGRTALVTHYRDLRVIEAWVHKGAPASMEIDVEHVTKKGNDPPGTVYWLHLAANGKAVMEPLNIKSDAKLKGGIYIIRHGVTVWNAEAKGNGKAKAGDTELVTKPTVMTLAKKGPVAVVPLNKAA